MSQFTVRSAVVVARTFKALRTNPHFLPTKSDAELTKLTRATSKSLATLSCDGLAADVRLSQGKLESMLWELFKAAKAEQRRRVEVRAAYDELLLEAGPCFYCGSCVQAGAECSVC